MSDPVLTIVQLTDLHLSPSHPFFLANFRAARAAALTLPNDLTVISGDLTINGADWEADLAMAADEIAPLSAVCLPGNHDIGECRADHDQRIDAARLDRYRRHFGPDYWMRDLGGWRIIGLNTQLMESGLDDEAVQRAWAEEAIGTADDRFLGVFLHKPMYAMTPDEEDASDHAVPGAARRWLADLLAHPKMRLVSCGHVHQYRVRDLAGVPHVWTPATSFLAGHEEYGGEQILGLTVWRLAADGGVEHELVTPPGLKPIQLQDVRGDYPTLRSLPPEAVAARMKELSLAA